MIFQFPHLRFFYKSRVSFKNTLFSKKLCMRLNDCSFKSTISSKLLNEEKLRAIRRSLLYVPGHDKKKIDKLSNLTVDCAVLDCEDGVSYNKKELARQTIIEKCQEVSNSCQGEVAVRVNPPQTSISHDDILSIFGSSFVPSAIVIPKVNSCEDILWSHELLLQAVTASNCVVNIILMIETAVGLINMKDIVECGIALCAKPKSRCRVDAVIFGSDDYCADIGISRSPDCSELIFARQSIVAISKAYRLQAIDMVYIDYKDTDGLQRQAEEGFRMGFTGKQVIHPNQIGPVQAAFSPGPERVAWARDLLDAYQANPQGVFTFRGQMIDLPTLMQAQNIITTSQLGKEN